MTLRMEISQVSIHEATVETKTKLTNDVIRLLQVRDKNEGMAKDWLVFLATTPKFSSLRPGEVYQAFKMAMARELLDTEGKEINMLPELSINTTSKVLISYMEWKKTNPAYQTAKSDLMKLNAPTGASEEKKLQIRNEFLKSVFDDIVENDYSTDAWLLYEELESKLALSKAEKIAKYNEQFKIHMAGLKQEIEKSGRRKHLVEIYNNAQERANSGKWIAIVANKCKSIFVSDYLKQFKNDFEEFKKQING
ncbi:hypothetical protein [Flavobacterium sp. 25HG05S-40]|uniref:hypothetical protein n=1 Tax=Flavobacterium sp. 25HG05S-40 TaxID=3458682 RepID=UPI0040441E5C